MPASSGARIERKHFRACEQLRHVVGEQPRRQAFGHRGLADAGFADEDRVVLAPAAQHFDRPLELVGAADQRIELAVPCAVREVHAVGRERIARRGRAFVAGTGLGLTATGWRFDDRRRRLGDAVRDEIQHIEPRDLLRGEEARGVRLRLLQDRGQDVAGMDFGPLRALHVEHGRLQHAAKRGRLLGLALVTAPQFLDRRVEVVVELAPQLRQVGAAALQDALAFGVVRQGVEQMLEREIRVPA